MPRISPLPACTGPTKIWSLFLLPLSLQWPCHCFDWQNVMEEMSQGSWAQAWQILAASASFWEEARYHGKKSKNFETSLLCGSQAINVERPGGGELRNPSMAPAELSKLAPSCINHPRHDDTCMSHRHRDPNGIQEKKVQPAHSWVSQTTHCVPIWGTRHHWQFFSQCGCQVLTNRKDWKDEGVQRALSGDSGDRQCRAASWRVPM